MQLSLRSMEQKRNIFERARIDTTSINNGQVFEWTNDKVSLATYGMRRKHVNFKIEDIASVIIKYLLVNLDDHVNRSSYSTIKFMSDDSIYCNFDINYDSSWKNNDPRIVRKRYRYYSTIIFAPLISNTASNLKNHYLFKISDVTADDKQHEWFDFQCGLFGISKCQNISLKQIKNCYERETDINIQMSSFRKINQLFGKFKVCYLRLRTYQTGGYHGDLLDFNGKPRKEANCTIVEKYLCTEPKDNETVRDYYVERCDNDVLQMFDKKTDNIYVCIDRNNATNEYYLSFKKNDTIIGGPSYSRFNGYIKLDFNKFNYLFALSSRQGFQYSVSFESK